MSETTLTLSVTGNPAKIARTAVSDPTSLWNGASGNYLKAAKSWAAAYVALGIAGENIGTARTTLAALAVKALDVEAAAKSKNGKGKASADQIGEYLGVPVGEDGKTTLNSGLPGQWRTAARMFTDLGMVPDAPVTRWLTSNKPAGLADAVSKATSAEDLIAWAEALPSKVLSDRKRSELGFAPRPVAIAPVETPGAPDTRENESPNGTSVTGEQTAPTRGAGDPAAGVVDLSKVRTNTSAIEVVETALARIDWNNLSDEDKASLSAISQVIAEKIA